ncbi:hypothetical protein GW846_02585 [Candidatus Gracilibacteria bacterium]|nr:hypothetical protein [Candidatus Gracilibacteria bacterium]
MQFPLFVKSAKIILFVITYSLTMSVFGASGELIGEEIKDTETLKEMQENISTLEQEKNNLAFKWETFLIGNESLGTIVKKDLSQGDKKVLESFIKNYTNSNSNFEFRVANSIGLGQDIKTLRKEQLILKQNFYIALLNYIQFAKLEEYKKYVENELVLLEKSKTVGDEIYEKNIQKEQRVVQLEEKVQKNSDLRRLQIQEKLTNQVESKLDIFVQQASFSALNPNLKIRIFQKFIDKIDVKLKEYDSINSPTTVIEERIFLFSIFRDILMSYVIDWQ